MCRWMAKAASLPAVPALQDLSPDHISTIIYTSGTTGKPKGVELSHKNIVSEVHGTNKLWKGSGLLGQQVSLAFLPWAHVFGMTCELHHFTATGKHQQADTVLWPHMHMTLAHSLTVLLRQRARHRAHERADLGLPADRAPHLHHLRSRALQQGECAVCLSVCSGGYHLYCAVITIPLCALLLLLL